MSWDDAGDLVAELTTAVDTFDRPAAAAFCEKLVRRVAKTEEPMPDRPARDILGALRRKRWFELMLDVADAFTRTGVATPVIRRQNAQALIETGRLSAAESVLKDLIADAADDKRELAEARGLLGRVYKQMYVAADAPELPRSATLLRQAVDAYLAVYLEDPDRHSWHGINVSALLIRAKQDNVKLDGYPDPEDIAKSLLDKVRDKEDYGEATMWDYGTAAEASLALGDTPGALEWIGRYVGSPSDSFELSSTMRQLEQVWRLPPDGETGAILEVLRAGILSRGDGGTVTLAPTETKIAQSATEAVPGPQLERILGPTGVQSFKWYKTGLERTEAIALISSSDGRGTGTGFLLAGSELCEHLPADEMFVVTNAHVVADDHVVDGTLFPDDAVITFEALGEASGEYLVTELIWSSPPKELDCSVLRLDKPAPEVPRIPVTPRLPMADGTQRVYIIGHPLGGGLSLSLQDNYLLDHESPDGARVHYRTPTEPGSSGSPVFNSQWKLVALHHAGSSEMPKLKGQEGTYPANEGLWIQKIRESLAAALGGG